MSKTSNLGKYFQPKLPRTKILFFCLGLLLFAVLQLIKFLYHENHTHIVNNSFVFLPFIQTSFSPVFKFFWVLFFLIFIWIFLRVEQKFLAGILVLYLAPSASNFLDHFTYNGVIDYFTLQLFNWNKLIFNLDDIFITLSFVILFIWTIKMFFSYYHARS